MDYPIVENFGWGEERILARECKGFYWEAIALAVGSVISGIKKFLIIISFTFIPSQGGRDLPKGVNAES